MHWNNKFSYPKSLRSIVSGSRMYAVNQEKLPSVTSILQATQSEEKKASLANWKARVGVTEANRIKNDASNRGTSMHSFLEKYLLGQLNLELGALKQHYIILENMLELVMPVEFMKDKKQLLTLNNLTNQKKKNGLKTITYN